MTTRSLSSVLSSIAARSGIAVRSSTTARSAHAIRSLTAARSRRIDSLPNGGSFIHFGSLVNIGSLMGCSSLAGLARFSRWAKARSADTILSRIAARSHRSFRSQFTTRSTRTVLSPATARSTRSILFHVGGDRVHRRNHGQLDPRLEVVVAGKSLQAVVLRERLAAALVEFEGHADLHGLSKHQSSTTLTPSG